MSNTDQANSEVNSRSSRRSIRLERIVRWLGLINPFGPIFAKELRVASRHKRNYAMRTGYVAVLAFVMMTTWSSIFLFSGTGGAAYRVAHMSELGIQLVISIGFFQFFALQIIAPVLTGTAINEEMSHRTLETLMMTPITSLQIVVGKLFSKLLTIILLVATALPLLAIIRVFGGIEWYLLLHLTALTICAALFAAAISLTYSIFTSHRAGHAAIMTYLTLLTIYLFIPGIIFAVNDFRGNGEDLFSFFNPFVSMMAIAAQVTMPVGGGYPGFSWPPLQCALLLGATVIMIATASLMVRRVALRTAAGDAPLQIFKKTKRQKLPATPRIVPVHDRPILWRESRISLWATPRRRTIGVLLTIGALAVLYYAFRDYLDEATLHSVFTAIFLLIVLARAAMVPAGTITNEKEAQTWEALLVTPMTPKEIMYQKAAGTIRRILPFAVVYMGHIIIFTLLGFIHPLAIVHALLILAGPVTFLICTGTYFSLRVKRTKNAVILNQGLALMLWLVGPFMCCSPLAMFASFALEWDMAKYVLSLTTVINPFYLNSISINALSANSGPLRVEPMWGLPFITDVVEFTAVLAIVSILYTAAGAIVIWVGIKRFYRYARA